MKRLPEYAMSRIIPRMVAGTHGEGPSAILDLTIPPKVQENADNSIDKAEKIVVKIQDPTPWKAETWISPKE